MLKCYMVVLVAVVAVVRAAYDEPDWGFQSYLDEPFVLRCNHSTLQAQDKNYVEWELPDGKKLTKETRNTEKLSQENRGGVVNMELTIRDVQEADAGVYVCYVYNTVVDRKLRGHLLRGLNLGGHKFREPFDEYRNNLMVGGIAALVLFIPLVTACLVYKFRFQTKEQKDVKHAARLEATRHQRYLENNGTGRTSTSAELSEISVEGGKGKANPAYDNVPEEAGTRL